MPTPPTSAPSSRVCSRPSNPSRSMPRWPNGAERSSKPNAASAMAFMARRPPTRTWSSLWMWSAPTRTMRSPPRTDRLDRFYDWVTRSYYGESADMSPTRGYIAPPLDGIWATAPYLHNGSVPGLRSLLDSRLRPGFWQHRLHPRDLRYHRPRVGVRAATARQICGGRDGRQGSGLRHSASGLWKRRSPLRRRLDGRRTDRGHRIPEDAIR